MSTFLKRGAPLSVAAALVASALAVTPAVVPTAAPGVAQNQQQDKAPVATPAAQVGELAFLNDTGAPRRLVVSGCPWPGSRAACARRSAGAVRRMR